MRINRIYFFAALAMMAVACNVRKPAGQQQETPEETINEESSVLPSDKKNGTASSTADFKPNYDDYFTHERLRLDFVLAGNYSEQYAFLKEMYKEKSWSGNPNSLIDTFGYGQYFFEAFVGDTLVFSHGFSALFEEWTTTEQAQNVSMAMNQTVWMPFPKQTVDIVLYKRPRETGAFEKMLEFELDPTDRHIAPSADNGYRVSSLQYKGDPAHKVDIAICGEAYAADQQNKFRIDAMKLMDYFWTMEPYASRRNDFNVWLVESVSEKRQVDIPQEGIWNHTVLESMFDTFYIDRYLTVVDHSRIADVLSGTDFDTVMIIANEGKYGGGGIYNSYAIGTSDNPRTFPVYIHEFGHSFAGLADEYYESSTAYLDYYPEGVEPWEPNITTQVDFASKWEDMVGTDGVGLYEGGGYVAKGVWRPVEDCRMKTNEAPGFCPVCQRAINRTIDFYTK
ncbi:MAG: IgA Peptidase M64 [Bacteroidales bacterium]|nr:IgA Peptidase M64 [Bacteroidales bacterium]